MNRLAKFAVVTLIVCVVAVTLASRSGAAVYLGHFLKGEDISSTSTPVAIAIDEPTATRTPSPSQTPFPSPTATPQPTLIPTEMPPSEVELKQAAIYAEQMNVSDQEAIKRLRLQKDVGELKATLLASYTDSFAGIWIEHEPQYRVVVALTSGSKNDITTLIHNQSLLEVIAIAYAEVTYAELRTQQRQVIAMVNSLGLPFESGIDIQGNRVEVYVENTEYLLQTLTVNGMVLPDRVVMIRVDKATSEDLVDIYGGLNIDDCTSGFSAIHNNGALSTTTAGHCEDDTLVYNGTTLPVIDYENTGSADIAHLDPVSFTPRNLFYFGSANLAPVYDVSHWNEQAEGEQVCHFTRLNDSFVCGFIADTDYQPQITGYNYNPTFVRVDAGSTYLATGGDSGGPWTSGNTGYGFTKAIPGSYPTDAVYMPQNFAGVLGLCVLRGPAGNPAPETSGSLQGSYLRLEWVSLDVCAYEIHRSQDPYFSATSSTSIATQSGDTFLSNVGVGDPNNNYYYSVNTITGSPTQSSQRIGEFDFSLVPGS